MHLTQSAGETKKYVRIIHNMGNKQIDTGNPIRNQSINPMSIFSLLKLNQKNKLFDPN